MRVGTAAEVAQLLRVSLNTVYSMAQTGELPTLRRVGRGSNARLRFDMDKIEDWMRMGPENERMLDDMNAAFERQAEGQS